MNKILSNDTFDYMEMRIYNKVGDQIYAEDQYNVSTDNFGILNYTIGSSQSKFPAFEEIDWAQEGLQLEVLLSDDGKKYYGGKIPFQSVPYSLYTARTSFADSTLKTTYADTALYADSALVAKNLSIRGTKDGQLLVWNGDVWVVNDGTYVMNDSIKTKLYEIFNNQKSLGQLQARYEGPQLRGAMLNLADSSGNNRVYLFSDPTGGGLWLESGDGGYAKPRAELSSRNGYGSLSLNSGRNRGIDMYAKDGNGVMAFSYNIDYQGFPISEEGIAIGTHDSISRIQLKAWHPSTSYSANVGVELEGGSYGGSMLLNGAKGDTAVLIGNEQGSGGIALYRENGKVGSVMTADNVGNGGGIALYRENGKVGSVMTADNVGNGGAIDLYDTMGNVGVNIQGNIGGYGGGIALYRENGKVGSVMIADNVGNGGAIGLYDTMGNVGVNLQCNIGGYGGGISLSSSGKDGVIMLGNDAGKGGLVEVRDTNSVIKVQLLTEGKTGIIKTLGPSGNLNTAMTYEIGNANVGGIGVMDSLGNSMVTMLAGNSNASSNAGFVRLDGPKSLNVLMSSTKIIGLSGANADNNGSMVIIDQASTIQAGMFIDGSGNGIVFGDVKNFRIDHPNQPGKEIWYASIEGPEVAAYARGTSDLINGEAIISLPEHFTAIANVESMTIIITPLSAESEGIAVIEKGEAQFKVKELRKGTGNYKFDWEVKCVRKGYEDYQPVRDRQLQIQKIGTLNQSDNTTAASPVSGPSIEQP